ncbi:hypothetical protein EVAR_13523_1 [Eumeta japonica]|uniref:Uncharacterized protein n=1 Tax=Eumeta variegata TaxID=151549 RepID=A0A4C1U8I8_EUMVA|nr:hypothetical protein EVAR_13523_1 [Eumeta japonica]
MRKFADSYDLCTVTRNLRMLRPHTRISDGVYITGRCVKRCSHRLNLTRHTRHTALDLSFMLSSIASDHATASVGPAPAGSRLVTP